MRAVSVLVGGALGALARWALGLVLPPVPGAFPWATFAANTTGAFGLGLAATLLGERLAPTRHARTFIGIGFFGAYTTFSTMALEGVELLAGGRAATAAGYWVATLLAGQMAGVYGMWLGRLPLAGSRGGRDRPPAEETLPADETLARLPSSIAEEDR